MNSFIREHNIIYIAVLILVYYLFFSYDFRRPVYVVYIQFTYVSCICIALYNTHKINTNCNFF